MTQAFLAKVQEMSEVKEQLKQRSMIYQVEAKEWFASFLSLPLNTFYHISCDEWLKLTKIYIQFQYEAEKAYDTRKDEIKEFDGMDEKTVLLGEIWRAYYKYLNRNNLPCALDNVIEQYKG